MDMATRSKKNQAVEARLYLAAIVESSDDAILSKDLDGIITSWNTGAERMFGYSAQEIVGFSATLLFPLDGQDEFNQIMECIYQGERVENHRARRVRKDGSLLTVSTTVSPIKDNDGAIIGASDISRDITAQIELERERETFVHLLTHELKTPQTALQGNIQLARRWLMRVLNQEEQQSEVERRKALEAVLSMLDRSQQQLQMQNRLINDVLDVSRMQANKLELRLAPCDLIRLVRETIQEHREMYPTRPIILKLPEQDSLFVYADRDRLQQVLGNYLSNALKFSPASEPIEVGLAIEAKEVRVRVTDHGPGISREQQRHIWEQFYQSSHTPIQNGAKAGLGLGLYVCRQLINQQGGQVGLESTEDGGATFWFSLPLYSSLPQSHL